MEFKVEDDIINIFGTNVAANPKEVTGIEVGMWAEAVYFLHTTGWEHPGEPSYKFVMNYDDGSSDELLIQSHVNSDDWCHIPAVLTDENSAQVWTEPGANCGVVSVIATKWENPKPNRGIKTIDLISLEKGAVPGVFAITVGGATAAVSSGGKLTATWAGLKTDMEF